MFGKVMGAFVLSLGTFLWFHEQSDALALAVAFAVLFGDFAYSVAVGDWREFGVRSCRPSLQKSIDPRAPHFLPLF